PRSSCSTCYKTLKGQRDSLRGLSREQARRGPGQGTHSQRSVPATRRGVCAESPLRHWRGVAKSHFLWECRTPLASAPVGIQPRNGLFLRHRCDLVLSDPDAMDQEVHDLAREGVGWRSRAATVWPVAATNTGRE